MDLNGDSIGLETALCDIGLSVNTLHTSILIDWMDDAALNSCLGQLNTSLLAPQGVNKGLKLMQLMNNEQISKGRKV